MGNIGTIGFDNQESSKLYFDVSSLETNATMKTTSSPIVYDGNTQFGNMGGIQAYVTSKNDNKSGITIENLGLSRASAAGITIKQNSVTNWLGIVSGNDEMKGAFTLYSDSPTGLIFTNAYSSTQCMMHLSSESLTLGAIIEEPSSILTMKTDRKGFIPPRLTYEQMLKINCPTEGTI